VVPASLDESYLDSLDAAVQPARAAGLEVEYGGGAGQIGKQADDALSEAIGLMLALGPRDPGLLAAAKDFRPRHPRSPPCSAWASRSTTDCSSCPATASSWTTAWAPKSRSGRAESTSGAAILVAGGTVVIAILGLYVSGVPFGGALGLSSAIVVAVTILAALTLIPALLGLAKLLVLNRRDRQHLAEERSARRAALALDQPRAAGCRYRPAHRLEPEGVRPDCGRVRPGQPPCSRARRTRATAVITAIPTTSPSSTETEDLVSRIRSDVLADQQDRPTSSAPPPGTPTSPTRSPGACCG
jgi:hypothetical protein